MKVALSKSFPLPVPAATAWLLLQDIEAVARCMPGASITERLDASHYKGTLALKLGPASLSFRGEIEVKELDADRHALHLLGRGTDHTGTSGASMELRAHLEPADGGGCALVGASEVSVSGKAAAFGARLMGPVADQVLQQFAANFAAALQAMPPPQPASAAVPVSASASDAAPASAAVTAAAAVPVAAAAPLNGLALAWAVVRDWCRGLFAARRA
jgi:carbon monoxide dehydrogenase subunit G